MVRNLFFSSLFPFFNFNSRWIGEKWDGVRCFWNATERQLYLPVIYLLIYFNRPKTFAKQNDHLSPSRRRKLLGKLIVGCRALVCTCHRSSASYNSLLIYFFLFSFFFSAGAEEELLAILFLSCLLTREALIVH